MVGFLGNKVFFVRGLGTVNEDGVRGRGVVRANADIVAITEGLRRSAFVIEVTPRPHHWEVFKLVAGCRARQDGGGLR